jgi:hypothetical protein
LVFSWFLEGNLMANKRRTKAEIAAETLAHGEEYPLHNLPDGPEDPEDAGEDDALAELRSLDASGGIKYAVHKISGTKPGEKGGYCGTYQSGDLSLDVIREQHGAGKFRIRATDAGGKYAGLRTVEIAEVLKSASAAQVVQAQAPAVDMQGIAALLQAVKPTGESGGNSVMQMMLAMMDSQTKSADRMMQMIMAQRDSGPKLTDLLALINASKDRDGGGDAVKTLMEGIKLGQNLAGGGEESWLGIASKGIEAIGPLLAAGKEQAEQAQHGRVAAPVTRQAARLPAPTTTSPAQSTGASAEGADVGMMDTVRQINWLKQVVSGLLNHAARNKNPELYAEVTLDNLPPFLTLDSVYEQMKDPAAIDKLISLDGRVANHRAWFESFRLAVIDLIDDVNAPDEPEGGTGEVDPGPMGEP